MHASRSLAVALAVVTIVGCGTSPTTQPAATQGTTAGTATRSEQKRAVAGKEASTVGPITAEVVSWEVKKRKDVAGAEPREGQEECVVVRVKFTTTDDTVKRSSATMLLASVCKDEFGNSYGIDSRSLRIAGDDLLKDITHATPATRVVLIDKPIPKATRLDLDLSASFIGVGDAEKFRFTLPLK